MLLLSLALYIEGFSLIVAELRYDAALWIVIDLKGYSVDFASCIACRSFPPQRRYVEFVRALWMLDMFVARVFVVLKHLTLMD